jgi:hypothetical protein
VPPLDYASAAYEAMSPTLLAMQPVGEVPTDALPGRDWDVIYPAVESRYASLRKWRLTWWSYWSELARIWLPRRYRWLVTANTMDRGVPLNNSIIDGTGTQAIEICASGMWTGLTSPSRPWFKLAFDIPAGSLDQAGQAWLEDTQRRLYTVLSGSNFYNIMAQAFQDVATFGTAPVIMYEDAETVLRCYLPCAGEYYLAVGARLTVDTLYREFTLTVQQIVEQFTIDHCPSQVREMWEQGGGSLDNEYVVCHAIEPNVEIAARGARGRRVRVVPGSFTYRELYWLKGQPSDRELSRRGFHEKPFFVARWAVTSNDAYGRSPGMNALGDGKQLQLETIRKAEFIEKLVRPPMGANPEMKNEPSSIIPGQVTFTSTEAGKKGFWPLFEVNPAALPPMVEDIKEIQARIEKYFFVDIFMAISQMEGVQPRNQLELTQRDLERLQVLGPFVQLFETETADPAITRALSIMERRRMLLPRPPSLMGQQVKVSYRSMLKIAQEASETASMERTFAVAGNLGQAAQAAGERSPIRIINLDKALRRYGDLVSAPEDIYYTDDQVKQADAQKDKMAQEQHAMAATLPAVQAAKGLSETQLGGGQNALSAILGQSGQGAA